MIFTIHHAKSQLSKLIQHALDGEKVIIAKGNKPLVYLQPIPHTEQRVRGLNRGKIVLKPNSHQSAWHTAVTYKPL